MTPWASPAVAALSKIFRGETLTKRANTLAEALGFERRDLAELVAAEVIRRSEGKDSPGAYATKLLNGEALGELVAQAEARRGEEREAAARAERERGISADRDARAARKLEEVRAAGKARDLERERLAREAEERRRAREAQAAEAKAKLADPERAARLKREALAKLEQLGGAA